MIPIKDIYIKEKKGNIVINDGRLATKIFNDHKIPEEYQKIILKVAINDLENPKDAFELLTNEMYYFKQPFIKALFNHDKHNKMEMASRNSEIYTDISLYRADTIKKFYQEIIDNNLALSYSLAVREVLGHIKNNTKDYNKILKKEYL